MSEETEEQKLQRLEIYAKVIEFSLNYEITNPDNLENYDELKAITKLRELREKIYNKNETIPIGDIHGDSFLFLGWMLASGAAIIDKEEPILKVVRIDDQGKEYTINTFNLKPNPDYNGRLVFLGDYIDRGPDSETIFFSLVNFLKQQQEQGKTNVTALLGNHETNLFYSDTDDFEKYPIIAKELNNNLSLFKICYMDENNVYFHTNVFTNDVKNDFIEENIEEEEEEEEIEESEKNKEEKEAENKNEKNFSIDEYIITEISQRIDSYKDLDYESICNSIKNLGSPFKDIFNFGSIQL